MRKIYLLSSVLFVTPFVLSSNVFAADCVTQNCPTLGYTSASNTGNCVKCPFGNYWACPKAEKKAVLGECNGYAKNCSVGQILNNDGTCSNDKVSGKTPIGVVVYISGGSDKCGYAMTAHPIEDFVSWDSYAIDYGSDVLLLPNYTDWQDAIKDFDVSGNMLKIISIGGAGIYPAAYEALNYAPSAAPTSKGKWALPTAGILNSLYTNLNAVNNAISKVGGKQLTNDNEWFWSSTEYDAKHVWCFCTRSDCAVQGGMDYGNKSSSHDHSFVRAVIAF